ncbi:MAG: hypothetical protein ING82_10815 [Roseomonas sp.]|nr:hypothetical protein [Roseomonas sp.]
MRRNLRHALLMLLIALPILPAHGETEALMEDPFGIIGVAPTPVGGQTLSLGLGYSRAREGANRDLYGGALEAEAGLVRGLDLRFAQAAEYGPAAPYPADDAKRVWGGLSQLGLRWQVLEEDGWRPAMGVFGALRTAYGETSGPSQSGQIVGLLSKTIIEGPRPLALSFNAGWSELFNAAPGERAGRYEFAAGLTQSIGQDTSLGFSYLRNQQDRGEQDQNIIAAGIWHRLGKAGPIMAAGAGAGIGDDSPRFLVFASLKWLFGAAVP